MLKVNILYNLDANKMNMDSMELINLNQWRGLTNLSTVQPLSIQWLNLMTVDIGPVKIMQKLNFTVTFYGD